MAELQHLLHGADDKVARITLSVSAKRNALSIECALRCCARWRNSPDSVLLASPSAGRKLHRRRHQWPDHREREWENSYYRAIST